LYFSEVAKSVKIFAHLSIPDHEVQYACITIFVARSEPGFTEIKFIFSYFLEKYSDINAIANLL
jgi:hypothetical protein